MKKLVKLMVILLAVVVIIGVAGVLAIGAFANTIAKQAVEGGAKYALGVETKVGAVQVGLISGKFGLTELDVANPQGYEKPSFLTLGHAGMSVSYSTLNQPTVELPELTLRDLAVDLEKKQGKANYEVLLDNLKKLQGESKQPSGGAGSQEPEKKFVIRKLLIENVKITANLIETPGAINKLTTIEVPIDKIELENVGKTGAGVAGTGVTMKELTSIIVQAVLGAATQKGSNLLPKDLLGDLQGQLGQLDGLKDVTMKVAGDVGKMVEDVTKGAGETAKKAAEGAAEQGKKMLEGLIPGQKEEK